MLRKAAIFAARLTPAPVKRSLHQNRTLDGLLRRVYGAFIGSDVITIAKGPMSGLKLVGGEHVSHAHALGTYESATVDAVNRLITSNMICYDLGASIGYLSLLMARKAKHVYAFEPAPHAIAEIRNHAAANGFSNITIVPCPVSNDERFVKFAVTDVAYGSGIVQTETRWPV